MRYPKTLLAAGVLLGFTTFTAEATLTPGMADGKSVVYSSVSNITWTGDANLLGTLQSSLGFSTAVAAIIAASPTITDSLGSHAVTSADFSSSYLGQATWWGAQAFVGYLNSIDYAGSNQWDLPSAGASPQPGFNQTGGQFGQLFYDELGGTANNNLPNTAYFTNEQIPAYWLGTEYAPAPGLAWNFSTLTGMQGFANMGIPWPVWAVSPGNVAAAVPEPGVVWLFGSGLIALAGFKAARQHWVF